MMMDIYFEPAYGKLYEKTENGICELFEYAGSYGTVRNLFIRREIPLKIDSETYYDIVTPYGYGGPLILECEPGGRDKLADAYMKQFKKYCMERNIVSEFVRFHPVLGNAKDFIDCYAVSHIRNTIGTSLADADPLLAEFSKSCRKNIRRSHDLGVECLVKSNPADLQGFKNIYDSTMNRNNAADYYFFGDEYFAQLRSQLGRHLLLAEAVYRGQTIAMALCFVYNKTIHIHLTGTLSEFLPLSPAYSMRAAITSWGKENGYGSSITVGAKATRPTTACIC